MITLSLDEKGYTNKNKSPPSPSNRFCRIFDCRQYGNNVSNCLDQPANYEALINDSMSTTFGSNPQTSRESRRSPTVSPCGTRIKPRVRSKSAIAYLGVEPKSDQNQTINLKTTRSISPRENQRQKRQSENKYSTYLSWY